MSAWKKQLREWAVTGTLSALALVEAGCGQKGDPVVTPVANDTPSAEVQPNKEAQDAVATMSVTALTVGSNIGKYTESFEDAVLTEGLDGLLQPPDMTVAGKGTGNCALNWRKSGR